MSIARHSAYNLAGAALPLVVLLVTVPIYLQLIGFEKYGILSIAWVLVGYFGFFDFGLGRATAQRIAKLSASSDEQRSRLFWVAIALSAALAVIAAIAFLPLARIALGLVNVDQPSTQTEIVRALPLLVAAVPIGIMTSVLAGALEGRRAFLAVNVISLGGSVTTALLPLAAAWWVSRDLSTLIAATLIARVGVLVLLALACRSRVPVGPARFSGATDVGRLIHFGGWTTVSNIIGPLLELIDRFLIGALLNAAAIALYVLPMSLLNQLTAIPQSLARALFPRLASAEKQEAYAMSQQATHAVLCVVTPIALGLTVVLDPFLRLWLGEQQGTWAYLIALPLIFGFWANCHARIPMAQLLASGRPAAPAISHAIEILPYLCALYVGVSMLGLPGAALAWTARSSIDALVLHWLNGVDRHVRRLLVGHALLVAFTCAVMVLLPDHSVGAWIVKLLIAGVAIFAALIDVPPAIAHAVRREWRQRFARARESP